MMGAAGRHFLLLAAIAAATVGAVLFGLRRVRDGTVAHARLEQMYTADLAALPELLPRLDPYHERIVADLIAAEENKDAPVRQRLVAAVLMYRYRPTERRAAVLRDRLYAADPDELVVLSGGLAAHPESAGISELWKPARDKRADPAARLARRPRWASWIRILGSGKPLRRRSPRRWGPRTAPWSAAGHSCSTPRRAVVPALVALLEDGRSKPDARAAAAEAIAELIGTKHREPAAIARLLPGSPADAFLILTRASRLPGRREAGGDRGPRLCPRRASTSSGRRCQGTRGRSRGSGRDRLGPAGGADRLRPRLAYAEDPRLRSILIERLPRLGIGPKPLLELLEHADSAPPWKSGRPPRAGRGPRLPRGSLRR